MLPFGIFNATLSAKQEEFVKEMNGSIYEITELMKNEDFVLELEDDFIENLTRTDYKIDEKCADQNVSGCGEASPMFRVAG